MTGFVVMTGLIFVMYVLARQAKHIVPVDRISVDSHDLFSSYSFLLSESSTCMSRVFF